jgi:hypothetical protein
MPTAGSGAGSPSSAASTASFRTAAIRTFMPTEPRPRASRTIRTIRHALTVTFRVPLGPETALPCLGNLGGARVGNHLRGHSPEQALFERQARSRKETVALVLRSEPQRSARASRRVTSSFPEERQFVLETLGEVYGYYD